MEKQMIRTAVIFAALAAAASGAFAQAPSQEQKTPEQTAQKAKKPKVWTDDNIDSLRSPSDDYLIQRQRESEEQAAAKKAASQTAPAGPTGQRPATVQQADTMIAQKQQLLASQREYLQQLQKLVSDPATTGLEKTRLEWRLKSYTATTQQTQADVAQLQAQKEALAKKAADKGSGDGSANNGSGSNQP
jgi:hypothetical protein